MSFESVLFALVALLSVASALTVILHAHPVYSALALVVTLFQISILFILLEAHMLAFFQVIIYAGAIMVLFLFVVMLLSLQREREAPRTRWRALVLGVSGILGAELAALFLGASMPAGGGAAPADYGSASSVSSALFVDHALSFELASVLLLVAVVGAVVIARRQRSVA